MFHPVTPLIFHNDGNDHFTEISHKIGMDEPGKGLGIAISDYDRDGRIDICVANDSMPEFLYHNQANGRFKEVGLSAGIAVDGEGHTFAGMGVDLADYNNDGLPDLLITDLASQVYALYRNNGDGSPRIVTSGSTACGRTLCYPPPAKTILQARRPAPTRARGPHTST